MILNFDLLHEEMVRKARAWLKTLPVFEQHSPMGDIVDNGWPVTRAEMVRHLEKLTPLGQKFLHYAVQRLARDPSHVDVLLKYM